MQLGNRRVFLYWTGAACLSGSKIGSAAIQKPYIGSSLLFEGSESLSRIGIQRIPIIYESSIFDTSAPEPNYSRMHERIAAEIDENKPKFICLDIERWHLYTKNGSAIKENFVRYKELYAKVSSAFPGVKFGFYGISPHLDYWSLAKETTSPIRIANWKAKSLQAASAISDCKVLFVPLYTFYDNQEDWTRFASHRIDLAVEIARGRDVFFLLWPNFHEGGQYKDNRKVPIKFWEAQLDFCISRNANVMLWGGWNGTTNRPDKFDNTFDWWQSVEARLHRFTLSVSK